VEQPFEEQDDITKLDLIALEQLLQEVLESEDYIRAIAIRDEINKRKTK
jgi:protein-arginine kinase activator protein McsA